VNILTKELICAAEIAAVEKGISYDTLMLRAGERAAKELLRRYELADKRILIVCGNGNNGGDGFVMARYLSQAGADIEMMLPQGSPRTDTAKNQFALTDGIKTVTELEGEYFMVIDAVFGIGLDRPISGKLAGLIEYINCLDAIRVAIDVPSGVLCDGGITGVTFKADLTLTMIAFKPCFFLPESNEYCGKVKVIDIGTPEIKSRLFTIDPTFLGSLPKNSHKGSRGSVLSVCGSYGMCGASILAAKAALRSGAGLVQAFVCDKNYSAFCASLPEAVTIPVETSSDNSPLIPQELLLERLAKCNAVLVGCGLSNTETAKAAVLRILEASEKPIVLDADGINAICSDINIIKNTKAPIILTPHPGEMARLCGVSVDEIERDRIGFASRFATEYNCVLVLKGANSIVAQPDGRLFFNTTGNAGMATGGSGDVLSGIIVSLLAQGLSPEKSARIGCFEHGAAGDRAASKRSARAMLPSDIIEELKL